ncbi:MAG: PDZ domain-containing protein [Planctomycetia bacterium]|nr:PDZ domain-containing protein [Planctomycetia bacterium]
MSGDPLNPNRNASNPGQRLMILTVIFFGAMLLMNRFFPQEDPKPASAPEAKSEAPVKPVGDASEASDTPPILAETSVPERFVTIGSLDPASPYRMLATFSNRGATVRRLELNAPKYYDIEVRHGWMGELIVDTVNRDPAIPEAIRTMEMEDAGVRISVAPDSTESVVSDSTDRSTSDSGSTEEGVERGDSAERRLVVECVGPGTPAQLAGILVGDEILTIDDHEVHGVDGLNEILAETKPGQEVNVRIRRPGCPLSDDPSVTATVNGESPAEGGPDESGSVEAIPMEMDIPVTLTWKPVELIRPEKDAPGSFHRTCAERLRAYRF